MMGKYQKQEKYKMSELSDKYVVLERWEIDRVNEKYRLAIKKISELGLELGKLRKLLKRGGRQLVYYQEVDGGCDHSVGICSCELCEVIRAIKEELGGVSNETAR